MAPTIHAVVGEIEVSAPADILDYKIQRAPGETDEEFAAAAAMYDRLFRAAKFAKLQITLTLAETVVPDRDYT